MGNDDQGRTPPRLGTMDHLRLSVSDIAAAQRFYRPLMDPGLKLELAHVPLP